MIYKQLSKIILLALLAYGSLGGVFAQSESEDSQNFAPLSDSLDITRQFIQLFYVPRNIRAIRLKKIEQNWEPAYTPLAIEMMSLARQDLAYPLAAILQSKTGQKFGLDTNLWFSWWWQQDIKPVENYASFKSELYELIDEKFGGYFAIDRPARIRLDEVRWGGVKQDGIPPLRTPKMISADKASYLGEDNIVFGIKINGDARAYPKRILAWHEMFIDDIGGENFAGVYCTLCGAVILYKTEFEGVKHALGTSGFLYRSNKLMYDQSTQSLWNTTWGEPVIGPLANDSIKLERSYLVTTTWGEWKRRHPDTRVLSLDTGYDRDYGEGVAYADYFSRDDLMFSISTTDQRLKNKDEILALTFPAHTEKTMAISADFLLDNPVYKNSLGGVEFVVLTDNSGANRVYQTGSTSFEEYDRGNIARDSEGNLWTLTEDSLSFGDESLQRLPAHRAFWFGWHSAHPDTHLVKAEK